MDTAHAAALETALRFRCSKATAERYADRARRRYEHAQVNGWFGTLL